MNARIHLAFVAIGASGCASLPGTIYEELPAGDSFVTLPKPIKIVSGGSYDCGAETLHGVMAYYGRPEEFSEVAQALYVPGAPGTFPEKIVQLAKTRGCQVRTVNGSFEALREAIDAGTPSIVMIRSTPRSNHFLVVTAYDPKKEKVAFEFYHGWKWVFTKEELEEAWRPCGFLQLDFALRPLAVQMEEARAQESRGQVADALATYRSVLGSQPDNLQAHLGAGNCLLLQGATHEAEKEYLKALAGGLEDPELFNNIAELTLQKEGPKERVLAWANAAVLGFEERARREPTPLGKMLWNRKLAFALGTQGAALQAKGDLREACDSFRRSLELLGNAEEELRRRRLAQIDACCGTTTAGS